MAQTRRRVSPPPFWAQPRPPPDVGFVLVRAVAATAVVEPAASRTTVATLTGVTPETALGRVAARAPSAVRRTVPRALSASEHRPAARPYGVAPLVACLRRTFGGVPNTLGSPD